jgi:anti-sigma B factor antagonist
MPLNVATAELGDRRVIAVTGDLDLDTAPLLIDAALDLVEAGERDVIVDVHRLAFCDSSGLSAFVRIANQVGGQGGRLALAGPLPMVGRVLEISGLVEAFVVTDTVQAAITELDAPASLDGHRPSGVDGHRPTGLESTGLDGAGELGQRTG